MKKALNSKMNLICAGVMLGVMCASSLAEASPKVDMQVHQSSYCTKNFASEERKHGIPKYLLMAIAATESGRWHDGAGMALPWPWAVNAEGKGHYFESKHDAVTAVKRMQQKGMKSIDVGCMQVNLKHHAKAFPSVYESFTTASNVEYAAKYLKSLYNQYGSWKRAVASYHSKTPSKGSKYFARVKKNWLRVIASVGSTGNESKYVRTISDVAMNGEDDAAKFVTASLRAFEKEQQASSRTSRKKPSARSSKKRTRKASQMKVIKVSNAARPSKKFNEVLVVRPTDYKKPNIKVSSVKNARVSDQRFVMGNNNTSSSFKSIKVASGSNTNSVAVKKGPSFIFY